MRYKFITRAHAKLDPPTNFSRSCWKPLWARVALLMSVFDPDAPPPGSCDLKHIIYSWTNSDWRVFPRIPTLTVKVAQNSSATLQQWEVVDETQSRCYTHTHTHCEMHLSEGEAGCSSDWRVSFPPPWEMSQRQHHLIQRMASRHCCSSRPIRITSCLLMLSRSLSPHAQSHRHQHAVRLIGINIWDHGTSLFTHYFK